MKNKYIKILFIVLCCFILSGCSNIKVVKEKQKSEDEVVEYVTNTLNNEYGELDIKLESVDKAYTVDNELIKNGKSYYFKITDKDGNKAYASYTDAFKIDDEIYDATFIDSYGAIYNNKELAYYEYLAEKYIKEENIVSNYYASDYKESDYITKAKVVYQLNYKFEDMTIEQYCDLLKLGFDLRKYRLYNYGAIYHDDPEVYLLFKGSNKYYYVSYYGLIEDYGVQYEYKLKDKDDYTDTYNLKSYLTFNVSDEEYNKMISNFNSIGKYLLDNVHSINVKSSDKNGYILINNYTKNDYFVSLLIKFKYDSDSKTFIYDSINLLDNETVGNFDGFIVKSW